MGADVNISMLEKIIFIQLSRLHLIESSFLFYISIEEDTFNLHGFSFLIIRLRNVVFYHFTSSHPSLPSILFLMTSNDREKVFILSYIQKKVKGGGKAIRIS